MVHGRNKKIRESMFLFLQAINLSPIEWTEAVTMTGSGSPFVGEVLDAAFSGAQAIVVVLTPDDEVRLRDELHEKNEPEKETEIAYQARANVLFEAGMALGRSVDRVILVEIGNPKGFSDIGGRHTIRLDNSLEKRTDLVTRLETAGCEVNRDLADWHEIGDFTI